MKWDWKEDAKLKQKWNKEGEGPSPPKSSRLIFFKLKWLMGEEKNYGWRETDEQLRQMPKKLHIARWAPWMEVAEM